MNQSKSRRPGKFFGRGPGSNLEENLDPGQKRAGATTWTTYKILLLSLLAFPLSASAKLPSRPQSYVTDEANILRADTRNQLESLLARFERASSVEIAVVTVSSLEGSDVNEYAERTFKAWGIGKKGKDNGLLFLIAPNERKMRIEVGYGLEGIIPDALAGRILDEAVLPRFRAGDTNGGVLAGTQVLCRIIAEKSNIDLSGIEGLNSAPVPQTRELSGVQIFFAFIFLIFCLFVVVKNPWLLFFLISRGGGGGGGNDGGFGGGFGGFGGGSSGGGGASRGW